MYGLGTKEINMDIRFFIFSILNKLFIVKFKN